MHSFKIIISLIIIIALILSFNAYSMHVLSESTDKMNKIITVIEANILEENWDVLEHEIEKANLEWKETQDILAILTDHFEIDNINISMVKMTKYIKAKSKASSLAEAGSLKTLIEHIPNKEKLNIINVF